MLRPIRHLLTAVLFLVGAMPAVHAGLWEEANTAFAAGEYGKARDLYEQVIEQDGPNADRLFNLGNTFAKLDQPGPAVLCYERAALLAPRDADIQANLKLTRPATASSLVAPPPWWKSPLYWLSLHEWSWITATGLTLLTIAILIKLRLHSYFRASDLWSAGGLPPLSPAGLAPRGTSLALPAEPTSQPKTAASRLRESGGKPPALQIGAAPLLSSGLVLALLGGMALQQRGGETKLAVLTAREPVLRLSPFATADPVDAGPPLPGQRVIPNDRHGGWVHLTIPGSTTAGWIPDKDVAPIIPPS